jgi:hypothetical protein
VAWCLRLCGWAYSEALEEGEELIVKVVRMLCSATYQKAADPLYFGEGASVGTRANIPANGKWWAE